MQYKIEEKKREKGKRKDRDRDIERIGRSIYRADLVSTQPTEYHYEY